MIMRWSLTIVSVLALVAYTMLMLNLAWENNNAQASAGLKVMKLVLSGQMALFFLGYELKFAKIAKEKKKEILYYGVGDKSELLTNLEKTKVKAKTDIMFSALLGYGFNYLLMFCVAYCTNKYSYLFTEYNAQTIIQFAVHAVIFLTPFFFWGKNEVALHFVDRKRKISTRLVA